MAQRYHHQSSVIGGFLDPAKDSYCTQKNIPIYDRTQENKARLAKIEEANRLKQQQEEEEKNKERYCLQQFKDVKSKVAQQYEESKPAETHIYKRKEAGQAIQQLQSHISAPKPYREDDEVEQPKPQQVKSKIDSQNPTYKPPEKQDVNYFKQNAAKMRQQEPKQEPKQEKLHKLGEVPDYLKNRKQKWEDDKLQTEMREKLEAELAKIPPGTRQVGDEERATLLKELQSALAAEMRRFNSFKLQADGQSAVNARKECLDRIEQLEKTINNFKRPGPLYIAIDQ